VPVSSIREALRHVPLDDRVPCGVTPSLMKRRTETLSDGLHRVELFVVTLAAIGVFVLATFFGAAAVLETFSW